MIAWRVFFFFFEGGVNYSSATFYFNHVSCSCRVSLLSRVPLLGWVYVHLLLSDFWCVWFICFTLRNIWSRNFFDEGCDASVPLDDSNGYKIIPWEVLKKLISSRRSLKRLGCADIVSIATRDGIMLVCSLSWISICSLFKIFC